MAVVSNLTVLLSARTEKYKSGMLAARVDTKKLGGVLKATGLNIRQFGQAMDSIRTTVFKNLSPTQQLQQELKSLEFLYKNGAFNSLPEYRRAQDAIKRQYSQISAAAAQAKIKTQEFLATQSRIAAIETSVRTPRERLRARLGEIAALREQGLALKTADRARKEAVNTFARESGSLDRAAAAQRKLNESVSRGERAVKGSRTAVRDYANRIRDINAAAKAGKISEAERVKAFQTERELISLRTKGFRNLTASQRALRVTTRLETEAANVKRNLVTPQQQLNLQVRRYQLLLRRGLLSQRQFTAAVRRSKIEILGQRNALARMLGPLTVLRTVALGIAGARVLGAIFELGAQPARFESQIRRTLSIFKDLTAEQEKAIRNSTLAAGIDTSFRANAVEAAEALEEIARAGFREPERAVPLLKPLLQFAQAAKLSSQRATELGTDVQAAFGLKVKNADQNAANLIDTLQVLAKGSLLADTNIELLSEAMIKAAPQARVLGTDIRETAAALLALAERGRKGFAGGTEFAIVLRDFARVVRKNESLLEAAGVRVFDKGQFRGIANVIGDLEAQLEGLNDQAKGEFLAAIGFQDKALRFTQQLIGSSEAIREFQAELDDTDGILAKLSEGSLTETFKLLKKIRGVLITILTVNIVPFIENISRGLNKINIGQIKAITLITVFVGSWLLFVRLGPKIVLAFKAITKAIKAFSLASVLAQVLATGPKGLVRIIGQIAAAGAVTAGAALLFEQFEGQFEDILATLARNDEFKAVAGDLKKLQSDLSDTIGDFTTLQTRLNSLRTQTRTPIEQLIDQMKELQAIQDNPALLLDDTTKRRSLLLFLDQYKQGLQNINKGAANTGAILRGSAGNFASVFTVKTDQADPQVRQLQQLIKSNATLEQMLAVLQSLDDREIEVDEIEIAP